MTRVVLENEAAAIKLLKTSVAAAKSAHTLETHETDSISHKD